jgi:DNA gyrase subunit B
LDKKSKKLPVYRVKVEGEYQYLYNDDDLAEVVKRYEKWKGKEVDLGETQNKSAMNRELDLIEFFESEELLEVVKKIEKLGIDIEDYSSVASEKEKKAQAAAKTDKQKELFKKNMLYRLERKDELPVYLENLSEALKFVQAQGKKGLQIQRYKGLGEMNPAQLWETTMDPAQRTVLKVTMEDAVEVDKTFTTLMGDEVEPRRDFIHKYAREVKNLDI